MGRVTDTLENHASIDPADRPNRLNRALAWVGIAAGSLFIVATVFFSGYVLGSHSGPDPDRGPHRVMLKPFPGPEGPRGPGGGPFGPMGPDDGPRAERLTPPPAEPGSTPPRP